MKKSVLTLLSFLLLSLIGFSQTTVFQENFEGSSIGFTSTSVKGNNSWAITSNLKAQGLKADSAKVAVGDTTYLTSNAFSTTGLTFVQLNFSHIAKIEFFDAAIVEVSNNNGATWVSLNSTHYLGSGQFGNIGNKFASTSYTDWLPSNNNAVPTNAWFKHESFNISSVASNSANVKIRFALIDANNTGSVGTYGWVIDSVLVTAAPSELLPPTISLITPYPHDTVYSSGPYIIKVTATDINSGNSGLDTVYVAYHTSTGVYDTLGMTMIAPDTFSASIPFYGYGRSIIYKAFVFDASAAHNSASTPTKTFYCKYSPGGLFQVGDGTNYNSSYSYPTPYGNYYWGNKEQYLVLASELMALGAVAGPITSLGFNVYDPNLSVPHENFSIKLGLTTQTALTTWITGTQTVFAPTAAYQPVSGINTHTFTTPFTWDGVSNLVVEVCSNNSDYDDNASVYYDTASFNSTLNYHTDASGVCASTNIDWNFPSNLRPNLYLNMTVPSQITNDVGVVQITNPTGGVVANSPFDIKVKVKNFGIDTNYTATINWKFDGVLQTPYSLSTALLPGALSSELVLGSKTVTGGAHHILAWTDNPDGISDFNVGNDSSSFSFFACQNLLNGTYTIGGTSADYATFTDAALALNQCGISGPVVFNITAGTYVENFELGVINGASSTNTITFKAANGDSTSVKLAYDALNSNDNFLVKLQGTGNIKFQKITFMPLDSNYSRAFDLSDGVNNLEISNSVFQNAVPSQADEDDMYQIFTSDTIYDNISIKNNQFLFGAKSIMLAGKLSGSQGWNISNNTIDSSFAGAILLVRSKSANIEANEVFSNVYSTDFQAFSIENSNGTANIFNNKITTPNTQIAYGIMIQKSIFDSLSRAKVYNNMIAMNGNSSTTMLSCGLLNYESKNIEFLFNTVHFTGSQENSAAMCIYDQIATTNQVVIKNNVFTNEAGGYVYYVSGVTNDKFENKYNNLYTFGGPKFAFIGTAADDFAAWKTASADENFSDTINPYYTSSTNLHVSNNMLNGWAQPISGITTDIDGEARSATPDAGADEFVPSGFDARLIDIYMPMSSCGLTNAETITFRIKNIGSDTISGGLTATYVVDANTPVSQSVTATILPNDTLEFSFTTTANLFAPSADTTFGIKGWVALTGDNVHQNDTAIKSVKSGYVPPVPTALGDTITYAQTATLVATSTNDVYWWTSAISQPEVFKGLTYNTPILYDSTYYYYSARAGSGLDTMQVGTGTATNINLPIEPYYGYTYSQTIYKASYLNNKAGYVKSVAYHYAGTNGFGPDDIKVFVGMTNKTAFTGTSDWIPFSNLTQVYNGTLTAPIGGGWVEIVFQTPFYYDGTQNLVVCVDENTQGYYLSMDDFYGEQMDADMKSIFFYNDTDNPDPANPPISGYTLSTSAYNANTKFVIDGAGCFSERDSVQVIVNGIPMNEVAVTKIQSPSSGIELTSSESITVKVKNYGLATQSTVPLAYIINTNTIVRDTITTPLLAGDSTIFTFSQLADLYVYGTYTIKAFTELSTDVNMNNDTTTKVVVNSPLTYCVSEANYTYNSDVTALDFAGILNTSATPYYETYTDFTNSIAPATIIPGATYPISVTINTSDTWSYTGYCEVYLDFNHDGVFTEPGEIILQGNYTTPQTLTGNITVPANAVSGISRLRIVASDYESASTVHPCGTYYTGETEDYFVEVLPRIPHDAGVIAILLPSDTTNEAQALTPNVVVKNFGLDTIFSTDISYQVNTNTAVNGTYTGLSIAPLAVDTITLASFNSPAGNWTICSETSLAGDSNLINDGSCMNLFGIPTKDMVAVEIIKIESYCNIQLDTVKLVVTNIGVDTINAVGQTSPTTVSYKSNNLAAVTETFTQVVAPGDTAVHTFANLVYLGTNNTVDSIYNIKAWVNFVGDNVKYNDTTLTEVETIHVPNPPTFTSPITVPFGSMATLVANSNDLVIWYRYDTSTVILDTGSTYITNYLTANDSFYVAAQSGGANASLTIGNGTDVTQPLPLNMYYGYTYSQSIYTPQDLSGAAGKITKVAYYYNGNSSTGPDDITIFMGQTTNNSFATTSDWIPYSDLTEVYTGTLSTTATAGWIEFTLDQPFVYDGNSNLVIGFDENTTGYHGSADDFYSTAAPADRSIYFYNDATNPDPITPPTTGFSLAVTPYIPNVKLEIIPIGCPSAMVPFYVIVGAQSNIDLATTQILTPQTMINLTNAEQVQIRVRNFGALAQDTIPVGYIIDNGAVVWDTIYSSVGANDSIDFTFTQAANLSNSGAIYSIKAFVAMNGDLNQLNDTAMKSVQNLIPTYCTSGAMYVWDDDIKNVTVAGINNNSLSPYDDMYTDFTSVNPGYLNIGVAYPISVEVTATSTWSPDGYVEVYVDYNRDGAFTEPDEVAWGGSYVGDQAVTGILSVPVTALTGVTRMRVVAVNGGDASSVHPCGTYYYGETEDYTMIVAPQMPLDAGVEMYFTPSTVATSSTASVSVRVRNYGYTNIDSLQIGYHIVGNPVNIYTHLPVILTGDSADLVLGNLTLNQGANIIKVFTSLPGDGLALNDTLYKTVYLPATVTMSYLDTFEGADLWMPDTIANQWERGVPSATTINTAYSPVNVWATNLDGYYNDNSADYLYSPNITVPTYADSAMLKFYQNYDFEDGNDGGYIQVNVNNTAWANLGYTGDPEATNWYTDNIGGTHMFSGSSSGWIQATYNLDFQDPSSQFFGATSLQFRFILYSNSSTNSYDGWAIDNFQVELPAISADAGVTAVINPGTSTQTGSVVNPEVTVTNFGTQPLSSTIVAYRINSGTWIQETFTPTTPIAANSTANYTFATAFTSPGSTFNFCSKTILTGDVYTTNDETCVNITPIAAAFDAGIDSIVSPVSVTSILNGGNVIVRVKIRNYGTSALTSMDVAYKLGSQTNWTTESWTGNIAPGDFAYHTFAANYVSPISNYTLVAKTVLSNDANPANDSYTANLLGSGINNVETGFTVGQNEPNPATGIVNIPVEIPNQGSVRFEVLNTLGQVVYTEITNRNSGKHLFSYDTQKLADGVYYYTVEYNKEKVTRKMIVTK